MVKQRYVPKRGNICWLDFGKPQGHEQGGRRPALVLSSHSYNGSVGLLVACPITSTQKKYPFEVEIITKGKAGVVLSDHIKSVDWRSRKAVFIEKANEEIIEDVMAKISAMLR